MIKSLLGKKVEMSQVFLDDGTVAPVTILTVGPCWITQIKTLDTDGYSAIQIGYGRKKRPVRAMLGHCKKCGVTPRFFREIELDEEEKAKVGDECRVADVFSVGEKVSITGISKGKGFAGVVKRWGFHGGPKTHGQSTTHRSAGSIGSQGVGRVFKGKKMPGRMGRDKITVKGLEVIEIDKKTNLIKIKGAVPGNRHGLVIVKKET
ncbi:50S ribosomal protein L3 [Patescibacteria group bacterium]|nr:50S ribosomal protein L3 [Patescibacteria group bacterium]